MQEYRRMVRNMDTKRLANRCQATLESIYYRFLNLIRSPKNPSPEDTLTRYLKRNRDYDPVTRTVVAGAFLPDDDAGILTKSVYNISRMSNKAIWKMGLLWTIINPWPRRSGTGKIIARADIQTFIVIENMLSAKSEPSPHPKHVDLVNWPSDEATQLS